VESTCEILHSFKQDGMPVKFLRCDNAGENVSLEKAIKDTSNKEMIKLQVRYAE
jgi:ribosomal protein S26